MKRKIKLLRAFEATPTPTSSNYLKRIFGQKQFPKRCKAFIEVEGGAFISLEDAVGNMYLEIRSKKPPTNDSKTLQLLQKMQTFLIGRGRMISISV